MKPIAIIFVFFGLKWECGGKDSPKPPLSSLLVFPTEKL